MSVLKKLVIGTILMFFISCGNTSRKNATENAHRKDTEINKLDQSVLSEYFLTDQITIDTLKHSIEVSINDSKLIAIKKEKMGARWESPEPWVSVAATHQAKGINLSLDTLVYIVNIDGKIERYEYSIEQLKEANRALEICEKFATHLNEGDFSSNRSLLSKEILDKHNDSEIRQLFNSMFLKHHIRSTELIGMKKVGTKCSIYINFLYDSGKMQTYAFSFLDGNGKIAGLQVPR